MAKTPGRRNRSSRFLPEGASALLTRWAVQAGGIGVVSGGLALAAAFATYSSSDPSIDTASRAPEGVHNMLGGPGAFLADALLQLFGLASWLAILALLTWGGRLLVTGRPLVHPRLRALLLLAGLLLTAVGLAAVPVPHWLEDIPGPGGAMGGALGQVLLDGLNQLAAVLGLPALGAVLALACGGLGLLCAIYALGLSRAEWRAVGQSVGQSVGQAGANLEVANERLRALARARLEPRRGGGKAAEPRRDDEGETLWDTPPNRRDPQFRDPLPAVAMPPPHAAAAPPPVSPGLAPAAAPSAAPVAPPPPVYCPPPLTLLSPPIAHPLPPPPSVADQERSAKQLELVLSDFGVRGEVVKVRPGPVVTLYELDPVPGTRASRVIGLADDIARAMSVLSVRIAAVPGRSVIGIERPNPERDQISLCDLLAAEAFERAPNPLTLILGKDIGGQMIMVDLARMPHLLLAGAPGTGKSATLHALLLSLLYRLPPDVLRLILINPGLRELTAYDRIPHLLTPVIADPGQALAALKWAMREMEDRYRSMNQLGVRNITGYNQRLAEARQKGESLSRTVQTGFDPDTGNPIYEDQGLHLQPLPYFVIVISEMAELMALAGRECEKTVQRLSQMARAAGIHLIVATEQPSTEVLTETIKTHCPNRISFRMASRIDSRTILGEQGAEQLLGQGDMLYMATGGRITRIHGAFVAEHEVESVVRHLRSQGQPHYVEGLTAEEAEEADGAAGAGGTADTLYDRAVALVTGEGQASISFIQRHLQVGYNQAARLIDRLEEDGVVSRANQAGQRDVLGRGTQG